jgi:hypothetical protein
MQLHKFIILLGTGVIFISFLIGISYLKKEKPYFFKYIFIFITLGLMVSLNTISHYYFQLTSLYALRLIQVLLTSFQLPCIGLFFLNILSNNSLKRLLIYLLIFFIILQLIILIMSTFNYFDFYNTYACLSPLTFIFSLVYFKDFLNARPSVNIAQNSEFWIVVGIFFHCCISFPIYSLYKFIPFQSHKDLRFAIFSISNISLIILYIFISKSYLCLRHQPNR